MNAGTPDSDNCQRWTERRMSWRHRSEGGFDSSLYQVVQLPEATARAFTLQHHYSGSYPAARLAYGLLSRDRVADAPIEVDGHALVGVAVASIPMSVATLSRPFPTLQPYIESLELGRFVLTDDAPANAESYFLAGVHRLLADAGIRGLISFADPMPRNREISTIDDHGLEHVHLEQITPGHVGVIYQATNAIALGRSTVRTLLYVPRHGVVLSHRSMQKIRAGEVGAAGAERTLVSLGAKPRTAGQNSTTWLRDALDDVGAVRVRHPGNFRYAWTLGGRAQRRRIPIGIHRTEYPKADVDRITGSVPA